MDLEYYQQFWGYLWLIPKGLHTNFDQTMTIIEQTIDSRLSGEITLTEYSQFVEIKSHQFKINSLLELAAYICIGMTSDPILTEKLMDARFIAILGQNLKDSLAIIQIINDDIIGCLQESLMLQLASVELRCDDIQLFVCNYFLKPDFREPYIADID